MKKTIICGILILIFPFFALQIFPLNIKKDPLIAINKRVNSGLCEGVKETDDLQITTNYDELSTESKADMDQLITEDDFLLYFGNQCFYQALATGGDTQALNVKLYDPDGTERINQTFKNQKGIHLAGSVTGDNGDLHIYQNNDDYTLADDKVITDMSPYVELLEEQTKLDISVSQIGYNIFYSNGQIKYFTHRLDDTTINTYMYYPDGQLLASVESSDD